MEVRVLGPVELRAQGRAVPLGPEKQRAVLALLALRAGSTVTTDELVDGLWGEHPPASAPKMVQGYVSRLRRVLAAAADADDDAAAILTRGRGYELRIAEADVDARRLERLVARGAGREALALWRGRPLADLADEPFAVVEARRLEELRLRAVEQALEADLAAGRHREVLAELDALVVEHPLRERGHALRMLALYRSGRQAEALEAFRAARRALVERVGVEPGPELRRLHDAVLRQDPSLDAPARATPPPPPEPSQPLVGRREELSALRAAWRRAREGRGGVVVLRGEEGSGRRRLAAELARDVHREGAPVLHGERALEEALLADGPALVIVDVLPPVRDARADPLAALAGRPVLVLVVHAPPEAATPAGAEVVDLGPLGLDAVVAIARQYAPRGAEVPAARLAAGSGGLPGRVHRLAAAWGRSEATRRLGLATERTAAERRGLRDAEERLAEDLSGLQAVRARADLLDAEPDPVICPYKGLAPFGVADAAYFFGRERLVAEMVARLVGAPLLGVVGPSGSGKSSALRAGLLAALADGVVPGSDGWAQVVLRPGRHPLQSLERALAGAPPDRRAVVAVDQLEELFTLGADAREREAFADALVDVTREDGRGALVVLALRADAYGRCAQHRRLASLLAANHVLVGPPDRDELCRAIELPARRAGLRVEDPLVERLLDEVVGQPAALPLLSTALLELWAERDGRELRLAAHERRGGVRGAVARLAESAYGRLDEPQRPHARAVLLRLADVDDEGAVIRARVPLAELDADLEEVRPVLDVLAGGRIVIVGEGTAELAHEALLREWPRLRGWLEESAQGRRLHHDLAAAARRWEAGGRDAAELLRGARLAAVLDWAAEHGDELNRTERAFVDQGRALAEQEARSARRTNRRLRALLAGVAVLLASAVAVGLLFLEERGQARDAARAAEAQRLGAQALGEDDLDRALLLARQGVAIQDGLATRGNLLATLVRSPAAVGIVRLEDRRLLRLALRPDGGALVVGDHQGRLAFLDPATGRALRRPHRPQGLPVMALAFSPDGSRLAVGGQGMVELLDGRTWRRVASPRVADVEWSGVAFSPDGRVLLAGATSTSTAPVRPAPSRLLRLDGRTGRALGPAVPAGPPGALSDVLAFTPDGESVVTASGGTPVSPDGGRAVLAPGDRRVVLRDARTLRPRRTFPGVAFAGAVSPDARTFAIGGEDGSLRLLDLRTGEQRIASGRHRAAVQAAVFTADGRFLLTVGDDARAMVWDVRAAAAAEVLEGHAGSVLAAAVDRRARTLHTAGADGTVISWDLQGDRRLGRPFDAGAGSGEFPPTTALSSDGETLATAETGGSVSLVDVATLTRRPLRVAGAGRGGFTNHAPAFGPGRTLVVSAATGLLGLVDAGTGRVEARLRGHRGFLFAPATSADGRVVATTGADRTLRLWDGRTGRPLGPPVRLAPGRWPATWSDPAVSPDGTRVAAADGGRVSVLDVRSRRRLARLAVDEANPTALRFSPDGRRLLVGSRAGRVREFSAPGWRPAGPAWRAHAAAVSSVDVSPDGRRLVTAGADGEVRLWEARSRKAIGASLPGPENVRAVALFARSGAHVLAVFADGRGFRWDVRASSWSRHACAVAGRRLTRTEWADVLPAREYAPVC